MQLFFALSGFFSHLVFERRGPQGYFVDRSRRLLIPLLAALPIAMLLYWQLRVWSHSLGLMSPDFNPGTEFHALPLHLWFLIYLWSFCALAYWAPKTTFFAALLTRALRFPPVATSMDSVPIESLSAAAVRLFQEAAFRVGSRSVRGVPVL